ncbi:MAG: hypothetical protein JXA90_12580, partial [Planctomycetes bacterium]|nr:hypothetical protein [Planctomycetota bacterium]
MISTSQPVRSSPFLVVLVVGFGGSLLHAQCNETLLNGGFETGSTQGWLVAAGATDGVQCSSWFGGISANQGSCFLGSASSWGTKSGTVYQRLCVEDGSEITASAWSVCYYNAGAATEQRPYTQIGIDPAGGTNPAAAVWSAERVAPTPWDISYAEQTVSAVAEADEITVFLRMEHRAAIEWNITTFDSVTISAADLPQAPSNVAAALSEDQSTATVTWDIDPIASYDSLEIQRSVNSIGEEGFATLEQLLPTDVLFMDGDVPEGLVKYRLVATYGGDAIASDAVSLQKGPPYAINIGGGEFLGSDGRLWGPASAFKVPSLVATYQARASDSGVTDIKYTEDDDLYGTALWADGDLEYWFPVSDGDYVVRILFCEVDPERAEGRSFDLEIEGGLARAGVSPRALIGEDFAAGDLLANASVSDGRLDVRLRRREGSSFPILSGIAVEEGTLPEVSDLTCLLTEEGVELAWSLLDNGGLTGIEIRRSNQLIAALPATATGYVDTEASGLLAIRYEVLGVSSFGTAGQSCTTGGGAPYRVNAGGPEVVDPDTMEVWRMDAGFDASEGSNAAGPTEGVIAGSNNPMYKTERWNSANLSYRFPVVPGVYDVVLHFAEFVFANPCPAQQRVFNVRVQDDLVLEELNILEEVGFLAAHPVAIRGVEVHEEVDATAYLTIVFEK